MKQYKNNNFDGKYFFDNLPKELKIFLLKYFDRYLEEACIAIIINSINLNNLKEFISEDTEKGDRKDPWSI